jgi:hypothetical protein
MSEEGFTPDTEFVRGAYVARYQNQHYNKDPEYEAEFNRWLAKHDLETFNRGFAHGAEYGHVSQGMWPTH